MATALDTLCAQSFGAGDLHGVGLHVQRMALLMAVTCIPIGGVWVMSPYILPFVVKDAHVAFKAGSFIRMSFIGLPAQALYEAGKRFLQVQGDFHTAMVIMGLSTPINAALSWFLAFNADMGLDGAALGSSLVHILRTALLIIYVIVFAKWSHQCWDGFSAGALRNWLPMAKLSFAGSIAVLSEYAAFEILCLSTSFVSLHHLAAQSILTTISIITWHIPFSISVVISTRIGHFVGAGLIRPAQRATAIHGFICFASGCINAVITFLLRNPLPRLFTEDAEVLEICRQTIVAVASLQITEATMCGTNGLLRGLGRQSFAAYVVTAVNYLAVVPFSIWLELGTPHWGLWGFWTGLPIGMAAIAGIEVLYMRVMRWEDCMPEIQ